VPLREKRDDTLVFRVMSIIMNRLVRVRVGREETQQQQQQNRRCGAYQPDRPAGWRMVSLPVHVTGSTKQSPGQRSKNSSGTPKESAGTRADRLGNQPRS
jgi:hypothetical protein